MSWTEVALFTALFGFCALVLISGDPKLNQEVEACLLICGGPPAEFSPARGCGPSEVMVCLCDPVEAP